MIYPQWLDRVTTMHVHCSLPQGVIVGEFFSYLLVLDDLLFHTIDRLVWVTSLLYLLYSNNLTIHY
jgi:hypothetical protein